MTLAREEADRVRVRERARAEEARRQAEAWERAARPSWLERGVRIGSALAVGYVVGSLAGG